MSVTGTLDDESVEQIPQPLKRSKRILWIEVAVILFLVYAPTAFAQLFDAQTPKGAIGPLYEVVYSLATIALIFFVVWVADGTLTNVGVKKPKWIADFAICAVLCYLFFI